MNAEAPILKAKDAPDLGSFEWSDPLRLNEQILRAGKAATARDQSLRR